ncbi:TRAP transporter substrate-binding protein [Oceanicola sp. S124]|uniref:TRAP transporter substrate-binding protein n=1 Tax=Oceanicola sp. S124 TaxID=1042378 RepID=UPI000255901A|nr:TRAP transporter substrate-binding protein [Oceanicola sp. S124]
MTCSSGFRALALPAGLLALLAGTDPAQARDYRLGLITPPSHQWTLTAEEIAATLAERTEGRVNILVMAGGQLGNEARMLQQLQSGSLDFGMFTVGEFANRNPDYGIFLAPFIAPDAKAARELLSGEVAGQLLDGFTDFGLHGLAWGMAGLRQIALAEPAATVADLAGQKIRTVPLAPELDFWRLLGAAPTPMPLPELYSAFANGQVSGMQIDFEGTWNAGYYRHAGQVIRSDHMMFPMAAVASGRSWLGIDAADRAVIDEVFAEAVDAMVVRYGEIDATYLAEIEAAGVPVQQVDEAWFGAAGPQWYESWRDKAPMLSALEAEAGR